MRTAVIIITDVMRPPGTAEIPDDSKFNEARIEGTSNFHARAESLEEMLRVQFYLFSLD